jgi:nitrogen fixation protein FixH
MNLGDALIMLGFFFGLMLAVDVLMSLINEGRWPS